jgi:hypothetical protein
LYKGNKKQEASKKRPHDNDVPIIKKQKTLKDIIKETMTSVLAENMSLATWRSETVKKVLMEDSSAKKKEVKKAFDSLVLLSERKGKWMVQV